MGEGGEELCQQTSDKNGSQRARITALESVERFGIKRRKEKKKGDGIDGSWPANRRWSSNSLHCHKQSICSRIFLYLLLLFKRSFLFYSVTHVVVVSPSQQQKSRATQDPTGRKTMRRTQVVLVLIDAPTEHYTPTLSTCSAPEEKVVSLVLSLCLLRVVVSPRDSRNFTQHKFLLAPSFIFWCP